MHINSLVKKTKNPRTEFLSFIHYTEAKVFFSYSELGPTVEKPATENRQNQKLLKCKSIIQIVTFNVKTLNRISQLPVLRVSAVDHNIDIVWYHHIEVEMKYNDIGNGWTFTSASAWKNSVNYVIGDVEMLPSPYTLKSLNTIEKIQPRMMVTTFNDKYNPRNTSDESGLDSFYNEQSSLHNVLIIRGGLNSQVRLHNSSKRNGKHLTAFTQENGLTCLRIKFQKRKGKLWTFTYSNNAKAQIAYILMNKKWINSILNCETYSLLMLGPSPQRYVWAYTGMWRKIPKSRIMTGPCLTIEILAINIR